MKEQKKGKATQYREKRKQIQEQVKKLKENEIILRHGGGISDFEGEEFCVFFAMILNKKENPCRIKKGNGR